MSLADVERIEVDGFERVVSWYDPGTGLRAVVAIHDTTLGPALGGVRMLPYQGVAALEDCVQLANAMTLKAAAAGLQLGGGWSVITGDSARDKTPALLRAHGRLIATLGGQFIPVNDVGTTQADIEVIGLETSPVCAAGDPSPMTALGVLEGIRACLLAIGGTADLAGVRVCIQGVGNVGAALADLLAAESAELVIADVDPLRASDVASRVGARVVDPDKLLGIECEVLAPCALGGIITTESLPDLACRVIAGGANNVLAAPEHAAALAARGILYAPDFCVNAGGLICLEEQLLGHDREQAEDRVRGVGGLVAEVIDQARRHDISTTQAATRMAAARLFG